jgi:hypothetical protein
LSKTSPAYFFEILLLFTLKLDVKEARVSAELEEDASGIPAAVLFPWLFI